VKQTKKEISMKTILAEKIWTVAQPILQTGNQSVGRPEFDPRKAFFGILFILENGIKWRCLPAEYGKVSTVHGKFMKWIRDEKIQRVFEMIRNEYLLKSDAFDNWYAVDTSYSKAPYAKYGGRNPTDRGKRGIKKNLAIDSQGAPLAIGVGPANQHDSQTLLEILITIKQIQKTALSIVALDSAYDSKKLRTDAAKIGFVLHASTNKRRRKDCPIIKPKGRWRVEHSHSWLNNFRSIKTCYAKYKETFLGFLQIAATIQLFRML
jgi:putative transposase